MVDADWPDSCDHEQRDGLVNCGIILPVQHKPSPSLVSGIGDSLLPSACQVGLGIWWETRFTYDFLKRCPCRLFVLNLDILLRHGSGHR